MSEHSFTLFERSLVDTRQKIIKAAAELILEEGLAAVRTSKIARRAGVADGSMYRHFESKEVLVTEVYMDVAKDIATRVNAKSTQALSLEERFYTYWEQSFGFFLDQPERFVLFDTLDKSASIQMTDKANALEASLLTIGQVFAEGKNTGIINEDVNSDHMIAAIYGSLSQLVYKAHGGIFAIKPKDLRTVLEVFWLGIT